MCDHYFIYMLIAFILVSEYPSETQAFRKLSDNGAETILALENENISMACRTDMPMAYCGFIDPSGKRYSFSGVSTNDGKCAIKIKATSKDSGAWRCHLGGKLVGVEQMQIINLKVVGELAAVQSNITAVHGKPRTLFCTTTKGFVPLRYCRFEPPQGLPFSIDSSVTKDNPLLKRYYFPANKSLDRGDCAVTIHKVKYEDVGAWTCGAGLDDGQEHIDVVQLDVEGIYSMSTASATGITFGTLSIIAFLSVLGCVVWKKQRFLGSQQRPDPTEEGHELEQLPGGPRLSPHSTPQQGRILPKVTVESPSDASEAAASPLVQREEM